MRTWLIALLVALTLPLAGCMGKSADDAGDGATTDGDAGTGDTGDTADDGTGGEGAAGSGNGTAPEAAPQAVSLSVSTSGAYPVNPGYDPASLSAPAGAEVTLTFTNAEQAPVVPHDWVLEGVDGAATAQINGGESTEVTFTLPSEPGEYVFFCSVGDHRERGMEGAFTVT